MIKNNEPLSLPEIEEYVKKSKGNEKLVKFLKEFKKISYKNAIELRKKLEGLDLMKLKPHDIAKIIEMVPEDQEDLNKIFVGVNLGEDESKSILDKIKEFK